MKRFTNYTYLKGPASTHGYHFIPYPHPYPYPHSFLRIRPWKTRNRSKKKNAVAFYIGKRERKNKKRCMVLDKKGAQLTTPAPAHAVGRP